MCLSVFSKVATALYGGALTMHFAHPIEQASIRCMAVQLYSSLRLVWACHVCKRTCVHTSLLSCRLPTAAKCHGVCFARRMLTLRVHRQSFSPSLSLSDRRAGALLAMCLGAAEPAARCHVWSAWF